MSKNPRIIYLPQETATHRYTALMSKRDGWVERAFVRHGFNVVRVNGFLTRETENDPVGSIMNPYARSGYSLTQIQNFLDYFRRGLIHPEDIIYLDDFWTPGFEAIPYTLQQIIPAVENFPLHFFSTLHAQTVDKYDFTYPMRTWMRPMEKGLANCFRMNFVSSPYLEDLASAAGISNVKTVGLRFSIKDLIEEFPVVRSKKKKRVVFSSRFDAEKQPEIFCDLARFLKREDPEWTFVMCSGYGKIRSNSIIAEQALLHAQADGAVEIKLSLSKEEYYHELQQAEFQVNTALQDWVSNTLLEALTYKCIPIYPNFRSFPYELPTEFLYSPFEIEDAAEMMLFFTEHNPFEDLGELSPLVRSLGERLSYHDHTLDRMCNEMRNVWEFSKGEIHVDKKA